MLSVQLSFFSFSRFDGITLLHLIHHNITTEARTAPARAHRATPETPHLISTPSTTMPKDFAPIDSGENLPLQVLKKGRKASTTRVTRVTTNCPRCKASGLHLCPTCLIFALKNQQFVSVDSVYCALQHQECVLATQINRIQALTLMMVHKDAQLHLAENELKTMAHSVNQISTHPTTPGYEKNYLSLLENQIKRLMSVVESAKLLNPLSSTAYGLG